MLDSVVEGMGLAAEYVKSLAYGSVLPNLTNTYKGEYEEIKKACNIVNDQVNLRGADIQSLIQAVREGEITHRADIAKYGGSYSGRQVAGINEMLDILTKPLSMASDCMVSIASGVIPPKIPVRWKRSLV